MRMHITLALQNLRMRKFRTAGIACAIAIASATLFISLVLTLSMSTSLRLSMAQLGADVMVVPASAESSAEGVLLGAKPVRWHLSYTYAEELEKIEGVEAASPLAFVEPPRECCSLRGVVLVGFDPARDFIVMPWIQRAGGLGRMQVFAGSEYALTPGSQVELYGYRFRIAGRMEPTGIPYFDRGIFMPLSTLYLLTQRGGGDLREGQVSVIMLRLSPGADAERVAEAIEFNFPELKAVVAQRALANVRNQMHLLLGSLLVLSGVIWGTAILLISVILSMSVRERMREFGILRALGATRRFIFGYLMAEVCILATLGGALGVGAGYLLLSQVSGYISASLGIPYPMPDRLYAGLLSVGVIDLALLLSTLASILPAYRSSRLEPYHAIRAGE